MIALAQDERHRSEHEDAERQTRGERVPHPRPDPDDREDRERRDDHERHEIVGRDSGRADDQVPLDDHRDTGDGEQTESDAAQALVGVARRSIQEHADEIEECEHRGEREQRWKAPLGRLRSEEAKRRRPERECRDGKGSEGWWSGEVSKVRRGDIETDGEDVPLERDDRETVRHRHEHKTEDRRPSWRLLQIRRLPLREVRLHAKMFPDRRTLRRWWALTTITSDILFLAGVASMIVAGLK